jgi:hypothetical protein
MAQQRQPVLYVLVVLTPTPTLPSRPSPPLLLPQEAQNKKQLWQPGRYVRVYGHVRYADQKYAVNAFTIRIIHDFNEVGGQWGQHMGGSLGVWGGEEGR